MTGQLVGVNTDNTVESVRDDLDNYGSLLSVVIETPSGHLYNIGDIGTRTTADGTIVVIELDDRIIQG